MKHVLRGDYWHSYNSTKNMLIMSHDPVVAAGIWLTFLQTQRDNRPLVYICL